MDKKDLAKQVKIETLYKGELRNVGAGKLSGLCPFHKDTDKKNPNFIIFTETNSWFCFVLNCKKGGDAINFYQELHNVNFKTAIKELAKR